MIIAIILQILLVILVVFFLVFTSYEVCSSRKITISGSVIKDNKDKDTDQTFASSFHTISVLLPVCNETTVVKQLLSAVAGMKVPANVSREILLLDDSNEENAELIRKIVDNFNSSYEKTDYVRLCRRSADNRTGFKAGNITYGLHIAKGEFFVIFDADNEPPEDFLVRSFPIFADPEVGFLQTAINYRNHSENLITRFLAMEVSHKDDMTCTQNSSGSFVSLTGTSCIWRRDCLKDAGGFSDRTLTEDVDLCCRAQLKGWKYVYLDDVISSEELPNTISAMRVQRHRWACGLIKNAFLHSREITGSERFSIMKKFGALLLQGQAFLLASFTILLLLSLPLALIRSDLGCFFNISCLILLITTVVWGTNSIASGSSHQSRLSRLFGSQSQTSQNLQNDVNFQEAEADTFQSNKIEALNETGVINKTEAINKTKAINETEAINKTETINNPKIFNERHSINATKIAHAKARETQSETSDLSGQTLSNNDHAEIVTQSSSETDYTVTARKIFNMTNDAHTEKNDFSHKLDRSAISDEISVSNLNPNKVTAKNIGFLEYLAYVLLYIPLSLYYFCAWWENLLGIKSSFIPTAKNASGYDVSQKNEKIDNISGMDESSESSVTTSAFRLRVHDQEGSSINTEGSPDFESSANFERAPDFEKTSNGNASTASNISKGHKCSETLNLPVHISGRKDAVTDTILSDKGSECFVSRDFSALRTAVNLILTLLESGLFLYSLTVIVVSICFENWWTLLYGAVCTGGFGISLTLTVKEYLSFRRAGRTESLSFPASSDCKKIKGD